MFRALALAGPLFALQAAAAEVGEVPFSDADLGAALRARGIHEVVRVDPTDDGEHLRVRTGSRERVVAIGYRRGPEAARLVAQEVSDLVLEMPAAGLPDFLLRAEPSNYLSIYPSFGVLFGVPYDGNRMASVSATVDLDVAVHRWLRFAIQFAGSTAGEYTAATMRLSVGAMFGPIELRAGSVQSIVEIYDGTGYVNGVQGALLARFTLTGSLDLVTELGVDKYLGSTTVEVGDMSAVSTSYSSPSVVLRSGVGLAWAW